MKHYLKTIAAILLIASFSASCIPKRNKVNKVPRNDSSPTTTNTNSDTNSNSNSSGGNGNTTGGYTGPIPTPTPTPPIDSSGRYAPLFGNADGSSTSQCNAAQGPGGLDFNHYRIPAVGHGNLYGDLVWSSVTDFDGPYDQSIFKTDNTLQIRIKAKPAPHNCDLSGTRCRDNSTGEIVDCPHNLYEEYSKLSLKVVARSKEDHDQGLNIPIDEIQFSNINVGECSPVRYFQEIPINGQKPFILDISNVQSDYHCQNGRQGYCPVSTIDWAACWEIELHMGTDTTNDIPR